MKKLLSAMTIMILLGTATLYASVSISYINNDSKDYNFKVKTCGTVTDVRFIHGTTSIATIQTACQDVIIVTYCGEIIVKNNQKISIKNGCIKIEE